MYKDFLHIDDLVEWVKLDKKIEGSQAPTINRYPIRFVLFDNFRDSFEFVDIMQSQFGCIVESVNNWIDEPYVDTMLTYSKLTDRMKNFVQKHTAKSKDYVITPFSELARFYDNKHHFEFNALISTVKGIEASQEATVNNQRIYIPIVGLEGKFSKFINDSQITVWYFKNVDKQLNYRLIITENTIYDVQGLNNKYTLVYDMQEWLRIWQDKNAKQSIISLSPSIFANAEHAQPDNAFSFCICHNVYKFLTDGLKLDFGTIAYNPEDEGHWLRFASEIDVNNFSFDAFFNKYFHIYELADYRIFLKTWFACKDNFEKWLLCIYYSQKFCGQGYICQIIKKLNAFTDNDLFASLALEIFVNEGREEDLVERRICLQYAAQNQVVLSNNVQSELFEKINYFAQQKGYATTIRYFTPLTNVEKILAISWLGDGLITKNDILAFFPDLYNYLGKSTGTDESVKKWALEYIDLYKQCKISNKYSDEITRVINEKNGSSLTFNHWYQDFKTTKTILNNRSDIEVYYWIDGLGIDWIPYITSLLSEADNMYLNEVYIARATCPTTTSVNKTALFDLSNNQLRKIGDLDNHAHQQGNRHPDFIIEEIEIVKGAIRKIISEYAGKKIAIVSDHGLSALSQLKDGLNLAGIESDHHGRLARRISGKNTFDNNYIALDDGETVCALRHESLCGKVPAGQSAHGGCTPEEVLVPLFIVSGQPNATNYSVSLISKEVSGINPIVHYTIKGISSCDTPYILYNGGRYDLNIQGDSSYVSGRLNLVANESTIELHIGSYVESSQINISLGAEEDDLLNF